MPPRPKSLRLLRAHGKHDASVLAALFLPIVVLSCKQFVDFILDEIS